MWVFPCRKGRVSVWTSVFFYLLSCEMNTINSKHMHLKMDNNFEKKLDITFMFWWVCTYGHITICPDIILCLTEMWRLPMIKGTWHLGIQTSECQVQNSTYCKYLMYLNKILGIHLAIPRKMYLGKCSVSWSECLNKTHLAAV
jgi:hypothetical protein